MKSTKIASNGDKEMLERNSNLEMSQIWSQVYSYWIWFEIEVHVCVALEKLNLVTENTSNRILEVFNSGEIDSDRIEKLKSEENDDMMAFLKYMEEILGEYSKYVQFRITPSDLLDASFNIKCLKATDRILRSIDSLLEVLKQRAFEHKHTITIGQSPAKYSEPTTVGLEIAEFYAVICRNRERLRVAKREIETCSISGAAESTEIIQSNVEGYVAQAMDLSPTPIWDQNSHKDRQEMFFRSLHVISTSIGAVYSKIVEMRDVGPDFSTSQFDSAENPDNINGLIILVRNKFNPIFEKLAYGHENNISQSPVESDMVKEIFETLDFVISTLTSAVENLDISQEKKLNILNDQLGIFDSQRIFLALTQAGLSKEVASGLVEKCVLAVKDKYHSEGNSEYVFADALMADEEVRNVLSEEEIRKNTDIEYYTKHVDTIFERVFGDMRTFSQE